MPKTKSNTTDTQRSVHLARLVPNMVTIIGLCLGLSAIRFAMREQWEHAVALIIIAAVVDGVDGRLARLLNATSDFGAQLDSLSDFLNFGVAPPFILYLWIVQQEGYIKGLGWAIVLFFAICSAIRLARFNSDIDAEEKPAWAEHFFVGIPAPAGAMLALGPMMIDFVFRNDYPNLHHYFTFITSPLGVCIYTIAIAGFMASRLPTFSFKKVKIQKKYSSLILVGVALLAICAFTAPWVTMLGIGIWYLTTLPFSLMRYYTLSEEKT